MRNFLVLTRMLKRRFSPHILSSNICLFHWTMNSLTSGDITFLISFNPMYQECWSTETELLNDPENNIQKTKIMVSGPITSWEIDGETVETMSDFILGGSRITADGDCSHEMKRSLLLGRKVLTNLDSIFKSRDIALPTKVHLVRAMVFPVVTYGCESWTVKKAER